MPGRNAKYNRFGCPDDALATPGRLYCAVAENGELRSTPHATVADRRTHRLEHGLKFRDQTLGLSRINPSGSASMRQKRRSNPTKSVLTNVVNLPCVLSLESEHDCGDTNTP